MITSVILVNDNLADIPVLDGEVTQPLIIALHLLLRPDLLSKSDNSGISVASDTLR